MNHKCLGHQQILAASLGSAVSPTIPTGTQTVWVTVDSAPVRFTMDGETDPTATVGLRLVQNLAPLVINNATAMQKLKFILESGSPNIQLAYFGASE